MGEEHHDREPAGTSSSGQHGDYRSPEDYRQAYHPAVDVLRAHLHRIEHLLDPQARHGLEDTLVPAWRRVTEGEPRWPVSIAVVAAIVLQVVLPERFIAGQRWLLPGLELALLAGLVAANPRRINRSSRLLRTASLMLIALITVANAWSAWRLVLEIVEGRQDNAVRLLTSGAAIWLTNVIVFALWYWDFDRGGPVARAHAVQCYPDFQFAQMQNPELAPPHWEPGFADYLYLSFTNATAFSPTDVLPLSRWAKMLMLTQAAVSLLTVVLVIARAVNVLK